MEIILTRNNRGAIFQQILRNHVLEDVELLANLNNGFFSRVQYEDESILVTIPGGGPVLRWPFSCLTG